MQLNILHHTGRRLRSSEVELTGFVAAMAGSGGSNHSSLLFATVAIATASITVVAYRYCWHQPKKHGRRDDRRPSQSLFQSQKRDAVRIKPPLRYVTPSAGEQPRIIYLTGIDKQTDQAELIELFSMGGIPIEIDASEVSFRKGGGRAWALYSTAEDARKTTEALHGKYVRGCSLCARLEWGVEKDGKRITDKTTHTAVLRGIQRRRGTPKKAPVGNETPRNTKKKKKNKNKSKQQHGTDIVESSSNYAATYSYNSILIGEIEYPFPSGIYSTKLIQRLSKTIGSPLGEEDNSLDEHDAKLLRLLSDVSIIGCGSVHRYAKEVSEAFAMVDALERAIKLTFGVGVGDLQNPVTCYCLGDGKYPIGAAALELFLPKPSCNKRNWKYIAIDPLLPKGRNATDGKDDADNATSMYHDRIEIFSGFSQDYSIEKSATDTSETPNPRPMLSIAIACHSHAPLEEFWGRMPKPKLCVALPCCAQFSELPKETPLLEYDNFEVYSAKRRIKIFAST